jgi:hypothetical protein
LGTAIKIILTPESAFSACSPQKHGSAICSLETGFSLSRQEVVALINTFHQLTRSIQYSSEYLRRNGKSGGSDASSKQPEATAVSSDAKHFNGENMVSAKSEQRAHDEIISSSSSLSVIDAISLLENALLRFRLWLGF